MSGAIVLQPVSSRLHEGPFNLLTTKVTGLVPSWRCAENSPWGSACRSTRAQHTRSNKFSWSTQRVLLGERCQQVVLFSAQIKWYCKEPDPQPAAGGQQAHRRPFSYGFSCSQRTKTKHLKFVTPKQPRNCMKPWARATKSCTTMGLQRAWGHSPHWAGPEPTARLLFSREDVFRAHFTHYTKTSVSQTVSQKPLEILLWKQPVI